MSPGSQRREELFFMSQRPISSVPREIGSGLVNNKDGDKWV